MFTRGYIIRYHNLENLTKVTCLSWFSYMGNHSKSQRDFRDRFRPMFHLGVFLAGEVWECCDEIPGALGGARASWLEGFKRCLICLDF